MLPNTRISMSRLPAAVNDHHGASPLDGHTGGYFHHQSSQPIQESAGFLNYPEVNVIVRYPNFIRKNLVS
jgi:hypothetical protein